MATNSASITVLQQALALTGVGSLSFSPIERGDDGLYYRTLRVFGEAQQGSTGELLLTIRMSGATERSVQYATPSLNV